MNGSPQASAAERVREALEAGRAPDRKLLEHALREALGLSARQARRFAAEGVRGLGASGAHDLGEIAERLKALERSISGIAPMPATCDPSAASQGVRNERREGTLADSSDAAPCDTRE